MREHSGRGGGGRSRGGGRREAGWRSEGKKRRGRMDKGGASMQGVRRDDVGTRRPSWGMLRIVFNQKVGNHRNTNKCG